MSKSKKQVDPKDISWALIEVRAGDLKPNPENPKVNDSKGIKRLHKSLQKFGVVYDGIANKDLALIDGHKRLERITDLEERLHVFVPSRQLTQKEYEEMNAIFDVAKGGETDWQKIEEKMDDEFFQEWDLERTKRFQAADGSDQAVQANTYFVFVPAGEDADHSKVSAENIRTRIC